MMAIPWMATGVAPTAWLKGLVAATVSSTPGSSAMQDLQGPWTVILIVR